MSLSQEEFKEKKLHLIIDEGQDMPIAFYETLLKMGLNNLFIVADQNQQLTEENSTRQDLTDFLILYSPHEVKRAKNKL